MVNLSWGTHGWIWLRYQRAIKTFSDTAKYPTGGFWANQLEEIWGCPRSGDTPLFPHFIASSIRKRMINHEFSEVVPKVSDKPKFHTVGYTSYCNSIHFIFPWSSHHMEVSWNWGSPSHHGVQYKKGHPWLGWFAESSYHISLYLLMNRLRYYGLS